MTISNQENVIQNKRELKIYLQNINIFCLRMQNCELALIQYFSVVSSIGEHRSDKPAGYNCTNFIYSESILKLITGFTLYLHLR